MLIVAVVRQILHLPIIPIGGATFRRLARIASHLARAATVVLIVTPLASGTAGAQTSARGTPEEAKALAERAAAHLRDVGPERALADFNDPRGDFRDRDLGVVTYDGQRRVVSTASEHVLGNLGRDATRFADSDGKEFGKEIIRIADTEGTGWVSYRITNPATMKVELKRSYIIRVGDYIVFVGAFRP
jgi:cytochrome c